MLEAHYAHRRDRLGTPGATHVDDSEIRGLLRPEAEQHRLGFFAVSRLL